MKEEGKETGRGGGLQNKEAEVVFVCACVCVLVCSSVLKWHQQDVIVDVQGFD